MNSSISLSNIKQVCIDIVRAWPYHKTDMLNTFATIRRESDIGSENFNKSEVDVRDYEYYVRNNQPGRQSGYLLLEHRDVTIESIQSDEIYHDLWFTVAFDVDCEGCPDHEKKAPHKLFDLSITTMRQFIKELSLFRTYQIDGGPLNIWASTNGIEAIKTANGYSTAFENGKTIGSMIVGNNDDREISEIELMHRGMIGCSTNIIIRSCSSIPASVFDYSRSDPTKAGVTKCDTCP